MYHNIVTGAVGGSWAGDLDSGSWNFDGQYAYVKGGLGFEFIGSFMGDAKLSAFEDLAINIPIISDNLTRGHPRVNSYMFNMIGGLPIGQSATWMPFMSGGIGWFHISGGRVDFDLLSADPDFDLDLLDPDFEPDFDSDGLVSNFFKEDQFGGNLGLGVFGFFDQVGVRADARYYSGLGGGGNNRFISQNISDFRFWRSQVGICTAGNSLSTSSTGAAKAARATEQRMPSFPCRQGRLRIARHHLFGHVAAEAQDSARVEARHRMRKASERLASALPANVRCLITRRDRSRRIDGS